MTESRPYAQIATRMHSRGHASNVEIAAAGRALGMDLPADFAAFASEIDGAEGWVGDEYLALWPIRDLARHNDKLQIKRFLPGIVLIGSDGAGEGYGIDWRDNASVVVRVPLIGLPLDRVVTTGSGFAEWLNKLVGSAVRTPPSLDLEMLGRNVYEKLPVILGGDPVDPANKIIVPLEKLLELAHWWNERLAGEASL